MNVHSCYSLMAIRLDSETEPFLMAKPGVFTCHIVILMCNKHINSRLCGSAEIFYYRPNKT